MGGLLQAVRGALGGSKTDGGRRGQGDGKPTGPSDRLQYVDDRWTDLKNAYIVYHQAIWQSLLFYANQSWIDWDDARKVWYPLTPSDDWVPRPRINRFSPTVDAVASNIYRVPDIEATANPPDDPSANMVAEIATKCAEYCLDKEGLQLPKDDQRSMQDDKAGSAAQQFVLCGGVFTILRIKEDTIGQTPRMSAQKTSAYTCPNCDKYITMPVGMDAPKFCPNCGSPVDPDEQEIMAQEEDEQGNPVSDDMKEYTLRIEIGNNLWAFPRAGAATADKSPFMLWAQRWTLDDIHYEWGFDAEPDSEWPDGYSVTYEHALAFWYTGYSSSTMQVKDSCLVKEMYVPPGRVKDHPEGFYHVVANGKTVYDSDWKFPVHPLTMGKYLNLPTIFFARSIAFDLVELQRELNAYESVIKLHAMVSAVDPIVQDANTVVSEITGRSDKIIKWRSVGPNSEPPHRMGSGHLDDGIYKQRDNLHAEFQNVSMAVNAFRGEQEGAITASSAIQQLRSQAELMFSKPVSNWNNMWCETVRKYVKFMQFYFTLAQLAAIVGPGMEQEIMAFKQADLDKVTKWVASAHGLPRTRDERRQELMTMWDKGALDINQPSVRQEIYDLFGETGMNKAFNKDATNARLENNAIKNGAGWTAGGVPGPDGVAVQIPIPGPSGQIVPPIVPMIGIEDLAVHFYFHADQIKSQDFKKWPPPAQQALIKHALDTKKAMLMEAQQMAAVAAGPGKGGSPGAGGPGGEKPGGAGPKQTPTQAQTNGNSGAVESQGAGA